MAASREGGETPGGEMRVRFNVYMGMTRYVTSAYVMSGADDAIWPLIDGQSTLRVEQQSCHHLPPSYAWGAWGDCEIGIGSEW